MALSTKKKHNKKGKVMRGYLSDVNMIVLYFL
jgi:hypothetical protein